MAGWTKVAEGAHFWDIKTLVEDMDLPKGTRIRIIMDTPGFDWLFDVAGAELAFMPVIPEEAELVDVWGENGQGIVEMEVDPPLALSTVIGIALPLWAWLLIAGVILASIVLFITVMIKVPAAVAFPAGLLIGAAVAVVGLAYLGSRMARGP